MPETRTTSRTGGQKGTKLARFDLIPQGPLTRLAEHFGRGAAKYADNQWRQGYEWSKSYAALCRHLADFWAGKDYDVCSNDPEGCKHTDVNGEPFEAPGEDTCFNHTGSHHMAAVAWHAFVLLEFIEAHPDFDDRYKPEPEVETIDISSWASPLTLSFDIKDIPQETMRLVFGLPAEEEEANADGDDWPTGGRKVVYPPLPEPLDDTEILRAGENELFTLGEGAFFAAPLRPTTWGDRVRAAADAIVQRTQDLEEDAGETPWSLEEAQDDLAKALEGLATHGDVEIKPEPLGEGWTNLGWIDETRVDLEPFANALSEEIGRLAELTDVPTRLLTFPRVDIARFVAGPHGTEDRHADFMTVAFAEEVGLLRKHRALPDDYSWGEEARQRLQESINRRD